MIEKELTEEIAKTLSQQEGCNWEQMLDRYVGLNQDVAKSYYYRRADELMSLIKSACWLKGEQKLPAPRSFIHTKTTDKQSLEEVFREGQMLMLELISDNFKPCQEWLVTCYRDGATDVKGRG